MTSLELVDFINASRASGEAILRHDDFLRKVLIVLGEGDARKFSDIYKDSMNRTRPLFVFPKREACLMAMSYSYELQARVFDRMTELEEKQKAPALPNFSNPAEAARAWALHCTDPDPRLQRPCLHLPQGRLSAAGAAGST